MEVPGRGRGSEESQRILLPTIQTGSYDTRTDSNEDLTELALYYGVRNESGIVHTDPQRLGSVTARDARSVPQGLLDLYPSQLHGLGRHTKISMGKIAARTTMLEQALQYTELNGYRQLGSLKGATVAPIDRNIERVLIQSDANLALQHEDCREANFSDYLPYDLAEFNIETLPPSFDASRSGESRLEISPSTQRSRSITKDQRGVVEELVSRGWSPAEVAKLSDVFQHPSCIRNVDMSLIPWLSVESKKGYWRNGVALFVLCVTMAISVGNVETLFKLNTTWKGMAFLVPYFFAYLLVVQPMISLELMLGQLFRGGQSAIYDKMFHGGSGLGTTIVIVCLSSGCFACARCSAEYILYIVDLVMRRSPWKLAPEDLATCQGLLTGDMCDTMAPLCQFAGDRCIASAIGKAYMAYQSKFSPLPEAGDAGLEPSLVWAVMATYGIVGLFHMVGMGNFTLAATVVIIVTFLVTHLQAFATLTLDGGLDFLWTSMCTWNLASLYKSSHIWSHSIRACVYEFIVGSGIYATLAAKSRVGYDVSKETVGVGVFSSYITVLTFSTACALIGHYSKVLQVSPQKLIWMLQQDCNYVLLPLGFQTTELMERTLLILQFCSCVILLCVTLSIQVEVAVANLKNMSRFGIARISRRWISFAVIIVLMLLSFALSTRNGKRVVWFLEIALGDLGRAFTVFVTSVVVGWLYGCAQQRDALGTKTVYVFNTTFWLFNVAAILCEVSDESLPAVIWWLMRTLGIAVATVLALYVNSRSESCYKPPRECLWWLFLGNVEQLRQEMCRISPISTVGSLPMRTFWSICIKWFIPCMLSNTIADIVEEIAAPDRLDVHINSVPPGWQWLTMSLWAATAALTLIPLFLGLLRPRWLPVYSCVNLDDLPSAPKKYAFWESLGLSNMFREFFPTRKPKEQ